jgi:hypothetical protein
VDLPCLTWLVVLAAVYLAPRYVMLLSAASLRSPDPVLQSQAIRRLSSVLWLYQQVTEMGSWPPAAGDLMEQWLLQALVMLVRPGADAGMSHEAPQATSCHHNPRLADAFWGVRHLSGGAVRGPGGRGMSSRPSHHGPCFMAVLACCLLHVASW